MNEPGRPGHRRRWARRALVVIGVPVVGLLVVVAGSYFLRERPGARSIDEAVGDFRADRGTTPDQPLLRLPEPGVYQATGSGTESISFPPGSQRDGSPMPVSVRLTGDDCFEFRIDYNEAHWHQWGFCHRGGELLLGPQENYLRWDFGALTVENTSTFDCDTPVAIPLEAEPGGVATGVCTGTNTAAPGTTTARERAELIDTRELELGGDTVTAVRVRDVVDLSGGQNGRNTVTWWFDRDTGLPLRAERTYRIETASPVGTITYDEEGRWELTDLEPQR